MVPERWHNDLIKLLGQSVGSKATYAMYFNCKIQQIKQGHSVYAVCERWASSKKICELDCLKHYGKILKYVFYEWSHNVS